MEALKASFEDMMQMDINKQYNGDVLMIAGNKSKYVHPRYLKKY